MQIRIRRFHLLPAGLAAAALLLTAAMAALITVSDLPLGVVGDWVWHRLEDPAAISWPLLAVVLIAGGAAAFCCDRPDCRRRGLLLVILLTCGMAADRLILDGGRAGLAENVLAPLDRFTTGYLQPAITMPYDRTIAADQVRTLLKVPAGETPAHSHVHPPANWLLTCAVCRIAPDGGRLLLPATARLVETTRLWDCATAPANTPAAADAALKLVWIFWGALTLGKILIAAAILLMRPARPGLALLPAAFGSGSAVLFLGHYDTLCFGLTAAALTAFAAACRYRRAIGIAISGVILGCGAFFSLGFGAPIATAIAAIAAGFRGMRRIRLLTALLGGLLMAAAAGWWIFVCPPWEIAITCWQNHRIFNEIAGRSHRLWIPYQLLDALLFCGPLATLMPWAGFALNRRHPLTAGMLIVLACWLYLLFGGAAIGEFGRLSALYLPFLLFAAGIAGGRCRIFARPLPYIIFALAALSSMVLTALLRSHLKLVIVDWGIG